MQLIAGYMSGSWSHIISTFTTLNYLYLTELYDSYSFNIWFFHVVVDRVRRLVCFASSCLARIVQLRFT